MIIMAKKTYTSKEVCDMFNLSAPRLLQFRKGQKVSVPSKVKNKEPKTYEFDPILIEGKDWEWNGSEVVFFESSITKLKERKTYRKYQHRMTSDRGAKSSTRKKVIAVYEAQNNYTNINNTEFSVQEIAEEFNLNVQKIYALRDISSNKPVSFTNYLKLNKDWRYDDGKVILLKSARQKIQEYADMLKEKEEVPKSKKITVLIGNKVFHLQGDASNEVIRIIEKEQLSKKKQKV